MDYSQIAKQAIDFQKTAFANWCNAVTMIQNQFASAMTAMMSQSGLALPQEAQKAIKSWANTCQEGFKSFPFYAEVGFFSLAKPLVQEAKTVIQETASAPLESPQLPAEETKPATAKPLELVIEEKTAAPAKKTKPAAQ